MEEWRDISGYEGVYQVSDFGRVRSLGRLSWGYRRGRTLSLSTSKGGYRVVALCYNGVQVVATVHRLVARAWHGPCPEGLECAHMDGSKDNNVPKNLKWVTHKENMEHTVIHGTNRVFRGEDSGTAKITEADALEIRRRYLAGESHREIAQYYPIEKSSVCNITTRKTWNHI